MVESLTITEPAPGTNNAININRAELEGVDITERSMLSALERHGVKKLEPP